MPQLLDEEVVHSTLGVNHVSAEDYFISGPSGTVVHSSKPYVDDGRSIRFDIERMEDGEPYPIKLSGSWFIAVKRPEGHIDFFFFK